jgi:nucleoside-diphosphate-sugar epimerase
MRVFVTGATGFIGSAVVKELLGAGHKVLGLARSDAGAKGLTAVGAEVQRGDIADVEGLKRGASDSDGVIHLAFIHDFTDFAASCLADKLAIETMGDALAGSNRPLIATSGVLGLPPGRAGTEDDSPAAILPRKSEEAGLSLVSKGVRGMVIRLSPSVHGDGDHGFVPQIIAGARKSGFAAYVGDGENRWPAVHRLDAARLYRLALEKGKAGDKFHGVADEGVKIRDIAEIIGRRLNVPAVSKSAEEVSASLGFVGHVLGMDAPTSSKKTQEQLGWRPTQPGLIADLEKGTYFDA